jgi:hypothetical protein
MGSLLQQVVQTRETAMGYALSPAVQHLHRHRYGTLFYTLLLVIGLEPLLRLLGLPNWPVDVLLGLSLIEATLALIEGRSRRILLALIVAMVILRLVGRVLGWGAGFVEASSTTWAVVGLLAAAGAIRFVLRPAVVRSEHIYAALSAYLLAGLFLGVLHWAIAIRWPEAFLVHGQPATPANFTQGTAIYFSFVTLATLGYGDIVPMNDVARGFAVIGAIGGQLYLAVLVARLVGLRGSETLASRPTDSA